MKADIAEKPKVMAAQRKLLERRYDLDAEARPRGEDVARASRSPSGRPPGWRRGLTWERLAAMTPGGDPEARARSRTRRCRTRKHATGGQVFPQMQIEMFPRLERFDVEFDLPEAFLPEFPPAIFLQNRPELGDVSRGEVVSINNFHRLFKDILTPVQLDGLRLLLTPFPQEEFNPTDDRKTAQPQPGRDLLRLPRQRPHDRAVPPEPGRPPAAAPLPAGHDEPARRVQPADPRLEAEPAVGRGLHRVRAADRLLQRRPDPRHEEGVHEHPRPDPGQPHGAVPEHARLPAGAQARHRRAGSTRQGDRERAPRRAALLRQGAVRARATRPRSTSTTRCTTCTWSGSSTSRGDGPIKTFTLRGIKDSPPYLHDGRCLTLEDTVEFFNLVLGTEADRAGEGRPRRVHAPALEQAHSP